MKRWWIWILGVGLLGDAMVGWWWYQRRDHRYDEVILRAARHYGVEPSLVKAVVWRESRFHPGAAGKADEIGLMQIRPATGWEWAKAEHIGSFTPDHLFSPVTNTLAGAWYLGKLLQRYSQTDNPTAYALADYNAGRSRVLQWNQGGAVTNSVSFAAQIGFPGTRHYVRSVLERYAHYRPIFPPPSEQR